MKHFAALIILVSAFGAFAQKDCDHLSWRVARFQSIRTLPPARVESFDGKLQIRAEDETELFTLALWTDENTDLPKGFKPEKGKFYRILYCAKDFYLYSIWEYRKTKN